MGDQKDLEAIMGLIMFSRNAKSDAIEAIAVVKKGDFTLAEEKIKGTEEFLVQVHHSQIEMLTQEVQGDHVKVTLLAIHSQDHLMISTAFIDLVREIIDLYRRPDV